MSQCSFYFGETKVIDRDISYTDILNEVRGEKRKETIRIMLGLITREIAEIENRLRELESEQIELEQQIYAIRGFLLSLNVPTISEIDEQFKVLNSKINSFISAEEAARSLARQQSEQASVNSGITYNELRAELLNIRSTIEDKERDKLNLQKQVQEKQELQSILELESRKLNRHLASKHVVSTFTFSHCPRCLQQITEGMKQRETDNRCMLCDRDFSLQGYDDESWRKAYRDIIQTINEIDELLRDYKQRIKELETEVQTLAIRRNVVENSLLVQTQNFVSPVIEQIALAIDERSDIERNISRLQYQRLERERANELADIKLPEKVKELERVTDELRELQLKLGLESDRYDAFISHFKYFLDNVDLEQQIYKISWDKEKSSPKINNQSYKKSFSGPDLAITVLAFHYALLAMSVSEPKIQTNHPKLLLIDEPEQQKMGKIRYQQVMRLFGSVAKMYSDELQIIVATETNDIPDDLSDQAFLL